MLHWAVIQDFERGYFAEAVAMDVEKNQIKKSKNTKGLMLYQKNAPAHKSVVTI